MALRTFGAEYTFTCIFWPKLAHPVARCLCDSWGTGDFNWYVLFVQLTKSITVHDGHIIQWQCRKFTKTTHAFYSDTMCTIRQTQIQPLKVGCWVGNVMLSVFSVIFRYGKYREYHYTIIKPDSLSDPVEQFQALASCVYVRWYKTGAVTTVVRFIHHCRMTTASWKPDISCYSVYCFQQ